MNKTHYSSARHQRLFLGVTLISTFAQASTASASSTTITTISVPLEPPPVFVSPPGGGEASSDDEGLDSSDDYDKWFDDETTPEHQSDDEYRAGLIGAAPPEEETVVPFDDADSSKPLETLKKLQQMLDETDYMTTRSDRSDERENNRRVPEDTVEPQPQPLVQIRKQQQSQQADLPPPLPEYDQAVTEEEPVTPPMETTQQQLKQEESHLEVPHVSQQSTPPMETTQQQLKQEESHLEVPHVSQQITPPQRYSSHLHQRAPPPLPDYPSSQVEPSLQEPLPPYARQPAQEQSYQPKEEEIQPLWTSKDRSKYKKMREMRRRAEEERRRLEIQLGQPTSSDDEEANTDDGLGYTLPNLPIYMSDAEGEGSDLDSGEHSSYQQTSYPPPPPPPRQDTYPQWQRHENRLQPHQQPYTYPQYPPRPPEQPQPPPYGYPPPGYPPPYYNPQYPGQQQLAPEQQQALAAQYAAAWSSYYPPGFRVPESHTAQKWAPPLPGQGDFSMVAEQQEQELQRVESQQLMVQPEVPTSLAEASASINFDSIQKTMLLFVSVALLSYGAVSPRHLPLVEYNQKFYENLGLVGLATLAPIANFLLVCDARENDINSVITSFYTSFTVGYIVAFMLEIILTTAIRLGVFAFWEPNIFKLSPKVPRLVLPWVVRENKYKPKRITLFAADFLSSCVAGPIVEEYVKLKILQLSVRLPRNFQWQTKMSTSGKNKKRKRKRRVAEAVGGEAVTNINSYVTHMLAASLGLKFCDSARRILMYTKASQPNKSFYAFCRGLFPIHELCGTMTALSLAKRDVLGVDTPMWKILFPAVFIHGMANFRGMKPIFKWNAATPWSEMQLSPWNAADDSTLPQLVNKGFAKLMWLVILGRVLGYCIKNYYLISRQARKRTTTYAGKQAAFSAELAAAEMLKKTKDKK